MHLEVRRDGAGQGRAKVASEGGKVGSRVIVKGEREGDVERDGVV